ncbi:hypothetical protein [Mangrovactinospora gilvigrisea]|uniref:hypothetical protein n=1 Tax=Mangrovactinospora gilvigrisea TaxID=1428644 RepID=UPI001114B25E|nr:hypothetical protein [Mangrovactinospora gilvigrisea]
MKRLVRAFAVLAVAVGAVIGGTSAVSAAPNVPTRPNVWIDTGQQYSNVNDCDLAGQIQVEQGNASAYHCNLVNGLYWELNLFVD